MEKNGKLMCVVRRLAADLALAAIVVSLFVSLSLLGGNAAAQPDSSAVFGRGAVYSGRNTGKLGFCCTAGWNAAAIDDMLAVFQKNGVTVTFALGLDAVTAAPELVRRLTAAGHEIAVLAGDDAKTVKRDAERTAQIVESIGAGRPKLLVFTGENPAARRAANALGMTAVAGSTRLITVRGTAKQIADSAAGSACGGSIVLCDPTAALAEALPSILEYYSAMGLTTSTVSGTIYN